MIEPEGKKGLPYFLQSFENLIAHFDEHFGDLGSNERGDTFLNLAVKLVPLQDEFSHFPPPIPNPKKSHDQGVDLLTTELVDGKMLCVQSKYKIKDKAALDGIISKFRDYESSLKPAAIQPDLFRKQEQETENQATPVPVFAVVTSSKLENIINLYEASTLASKSYYQTLLDARRLTMLDGPKILLILQNLYRKAHLIPTDLVLVSLDGWFHASGNVYIGCIRGAALTRLYHEHGDALFFENIRDFLGVSSGRVVQTRSAVNQEIIHTIRDAPGRMLARNNGITMRAIGATLENHDTLRLNRAAIVNGCQTTMCLVQCEPVAEDCLVPVKVVITDDAWDIAKATNYQNQVLRVDLDMARYLRPQLARRSAALLGYAVEGETESTASAVLNTIYQSKVDYEELRFLYLGLFSRKPNNIFDSNYTELRGDVLSLLYDQADSEEQVFSVLLLMLKHGRIALEQCQQRFASEEYASIFRRFFKEDKIVYRAFLAVAAASSCVRDDISVRSPDHITETHRMRNFLGKCRSALENRNGGFSSAYTYAFAVVADSLLDVSVGKDTGDIQQTMHQKVKNMTFDSIYKRILLRIDTSGV